MQSFHWSKEIRENDLKNNRWTRIIFCGGNVLIKKNCRTVLLKGLFNQWIQKNLGMVTALTFQVTLKHINEGKTMDFSIEPSPLELDQNVNFIHDNCLCLCLCLCTALLSNSNEPTAKLLFGELEWGEWLPPLHVLLMRDLSAFVMHFQSKCELQTGSKV